MNHESMDTIENGLLVGGFVAGMLSDLIGISPGTAGILLFALVLTAKVVRGEDR